MVIATGPNDIKERLSIAYVAAVAARAGCQISKLDIDKQSVDATVRPVSGRKVSIDLQLKATSSECIRDDRVAFNLPIKNYDDLRDPHCTAPHFLVALVLDPRDEFWLTSNEEALLIRRCAYWMDLRGQPATTNKAAVTVAIPRAQRFDVVALRRMMTDTFQQASPQ